MSHFAKIIDGVVTEVIVAEQDFIDTLPGQWVQTSYNTRGGIHYGLDGNPSSRPALRTNFAGIGDIYDAESDTFRKPNEEKHKYFNERTGYWESPLANQAISPKAIPLTDKGENQHKAYVSKLARIFFDPKTLSNLSSSLGLEFVTDPELAEIALPINDADVVAVVNNPACEHIAPMTKEALYAITDRIGMQTLSLASLPAWIPKTPEEALALPDGPIFVKRRRTYSKDSNPFAYTEWPNPQAFVDAADSSFWAGQNDTSSASGEFVVQPGITHPFSDLDIHIAINQKSEVLVMSVMSVTHEGINELGHVVPFSGDCSKVIEDIKRVCLEQKLKAGLHNLQFVQYGGEWVLLDWNPRLTGAYAKILTTIYPVLDDGILHMLGLPLRYEANDLYREQRCYRKNSLTSADEVKVLQCGLFPRYKGDKRNDQLVSVAGIGESKEEVQNRFTTFESLIK